MTTIYLIRHAEAEGNLYRRIHGWYDALVTENGLRQIQALEQRFQGEHFDAVWSSDLYRTCTTARAVYEPRGLELRTDPELRELNMGDWEDQTWGQVRRTQPGELDRFNRSDPTWTAPRGEGLGELGERVERALRRIAAAHPDQTVAVFSHGTAIRQALARIKGIPPEEWHGRRHSDNTAVSCTNYKDILGLLMDCHGHMGDHLIINKFISLCEHYISIQSQHTSKFRCLKDINSLIVALFRIELTIYPDTVLDIRCMKF